MELRLVDLMMSMGIGVAQGARAGFRPGGLDCTVSRSGTTINVTAGVGCGYRAGQGLYRFQLAATSPGTLTAAHASFSRIDLVYVRIWDNSVDSSGLYKADTVLLTGTPSGSPVAPTPGATEIYIPLATITVPSTGGGGTGSATISTTIRPATVAPGGILPVSSAADIAIVGTYTGQARYNTVRGCPEYWTGAAWAAQGDWTAYTPTWGGALTTVGASVSTGRWTRIGSTVHLHAKLAWGTGSVFSGVNHLTFTVPTSSTTANSNGTIWVGVGYFSDGVNPYKMAVPVLNGNTTVGNFFAVKPSDNTYWTPQSQGWTWTTAGAYCAMSMSYEAA
ncbi:hypothetical protein ACIPY6_28785 [Streptomyces sp. NPDC090054]|uniref:hypothetical protein n=1 Tax=Streptomyces sp. NPDC090054 TaxID=3365933 RepID=UPI0038012848